MYYRDLIPDAIEIVSAWDVPDESFTQVVIEQAMIMSGIPADEILEGHTEMH